MSEMRQVKAVRGVALAGMLAIAGVLATPAARADMLLTEATTFISGTQSTVYTLYAAGPGTVNVALTDLVWPERLASLSFALTTSTGVLAQLGAPGQMEFDLTSAGTYFAIVSGVAQGDWDVGMYSLRVGFGPAVPLPPALGLLLMGLASAWGVTRNRNERPVVLQS